MWNTSSRRYNGPQGVMQRERRWQDMADEGYELAHLVLTVFEPGVRRVHNPVPVLTRLDELARQGDAGAMCLMAAIVMQLPKSVGFDWSPYVERERVWAQKGMELGHPECLAIVGGRLVFGSDGMPKDPRRGMDMMFKAFREGYTFWVGISWMHIRERDLAERSNRRLLYCWQYHDAQQRFIEPETSFKVYLQYKAAAAQRELLMSELEGLRQWHPTIEECIDLTRQVPGF